MKYLFALFVLHVFCYVFVIATCLSLLVFASAPD